MPSCLDVCASTMSLMEMIFCTPKWIQFRDVSWILQLGSLHTLWKKTPTFKRMLIFQLLILNGFWAKILLSGINRLVFVGRLRVSKTGCWPTRQLQGIGVQPVEYWLRMSANGSPSSFWFIGATGEYIDTVDGRNPKQPPGMYWNPINNRIFTISTGAGFQQSTVSTRKQYDHCWTDIRESRNFEFFLSFRNQDKKSTLIYINEIGKTSSKP